MSTKTNSHQCQCCPQHSEAPISESQSRISRRNFVSMGGALLGGLSLPWLQSSVFAAGAAETVGATKMEDPILMPKARVPLIVKPILVHDLPVRQEKTSWRAWGGIETQEQANEEVGRIRAELAILKARADYPVEFLDVSAVTDIKQMKGHPDVAKCDTILVYGAGFNIHGIQDFGKDVIIFLRWKSGPVYLQWETLSPHILRQYTDSAKLPGITHDDVVVDKIEELDWRFRSLCGLKNTMGSKIIAVGGAGAWGTWIDTADIKIEEVLGRVKKTWNLEIHDVNYNELGKLITEAKADKNVMARAKQRADAHLKIPGTKLETTMDFFVNCFVLDEIFRLLMKKVDTNLITVGGCMHTILPILESTACYTLTTLNDDGYLAFCESDFHTIPSGVLLGNIVGKPVFLCNQTYPTDNVTVVAHCTAPRKMDGKNFDPVRIVTHFESDYGAAPWVQVPRGTEMTLIATPFKGYRWLGLKGKVVEVPYLPICRTQLELEYEPSSRLLAERIVGQHWMACYGDYRKEIGYALRRVGIEWDTLNV